MKDLYSQVETLGKSAKYDCVLIGNALDVCDELLRLGLVSVDDAYGGADDGARLSFFPTKRKKGQFRLGIGPVSKPWRRF